MGGNILIQAWLYDDSKGTKLATTDKSIMVGAKEKDWEPIYLAIPITDIKKWSDTYSEIEGEED